MSLNKNVALLQALGLSPYDEHSAEEIREAREQLCRTLRVSDDVSDETLIQMEHDSMEHLDTVPEDDELRSRTAAEVLPPPNFEIVQPIQPIQMQAAVPNTAPELDVFAQLPGNRQFDEQVNSQQLRDIVRTKITATPVEVEALPQPRSSFTGLKSVSARAAEEAEAAAEAECAREAKNQSKNSLRSAMQKQVKITQSTEKPLLARIFEAFKAKRDQ
jgi:hypothetical protein